VLSTCVRRAEWKGNLSEMLGYSVVVGRREGGFPAGKLWSCCWEATCKARARAGGALDLGVPLRAHCWPVMRPLQYLNVISELIYAFSRSISQQYI